MDQQMEKGGGEFWLEQGGIQCNGSVFFFLSNLRLDYVLSYRT